MAGRRPGCGCKASLLALKNRPWVIIVWRRIKSGVRLQCLACGVTWWSKQPYVSKIKLAKKCKDKRRIFSKMGG